MAILLLYRNKQTDSGVTIMKYALSFFALVFFIGCSNNNQITIDNLSRGAIYFNCRAKLDTIPVNSSKIISDIPNGTFDYATTYAVPFGYKTATASQEAAGTLTFEEKYTKIRIVYSATSSDDGEYQLGCTVTSTRNLSSGNTSVTSPER
jgi:hypothetical protein